ncbi:MAG: hypothetical protein QOK40_3352 [Miltoncostaeaceae bacterium]|jgi:capsular polysaccharide biosynthesis protein|nr:hypothetical protein [Miltoncostaeaceae bacterium]
MDGNNDIAPPQVTRGPAGALGQMNAAIVSALVGKRARLHNGGPREPVSRGALIWRAKRLILAVAAVCGVLTLVVSMLVPATYSSSATVRVSFPPALGGLRDTVLASNDLASQYAQLVTSTPVVDDAARRLGISSSNLRGAISAGTVADQNLISLSAQGSSAAEAGGRSNALADAFTRYLAQANARQTAAYATVVSKRLLPLQRQIDAAQARMARAARGFAAAGQGAREAANATFASQQSLLATLQGQRQQLLSGLAQAAAGAQPSVEIVTVAGPGDKVQPRPVLYAVLALVLGGLVTAQIVVLAHRRG